MGSDKQYDYIIVGAGIAGLATAELLTRSGYSVALIEKNTQVCQEASGQHHGWFHFGSLYSIFRSNQYMRTLVGGIDDMLAFYSHFPGMNISVDASGRLAFADVKSAWIRDEPIEYIVAARNDPDFDLKVFDGVGNYVKKCFFLLVWELAIKQFISRHKRFYRFDWRNGPASKWIPKAGWRDYSRDVITKPSLKDINLDRDTHFKVVGFDRPMNAPAIVADLVKAFITQGGNLLTQTEYNGHQKSDGGIVVETSRGEVNGGHLLLSCGRYFKDILPKKRIQIVASPILVVYPQLCERNFVRLTPFMDKTINHLCHEVDGKKYSVIGGGYFADTNDSDAIEAAKRDLETMANHVFPRLKNAHFRSVYVGYKTEFVAEPGQRNYQYHIQALDKDVTVLLPGKFSLGFSLAVNTVIKLTSESPAQQNENLELSDAPLDSITMLHQQLVSDYIMKNPSKTV